MEINGSFKSFTAALLTLGSVGGTLWVGIDAVKTVYAADAKADRAQIMAQQALDKTDGIDVIQQNQQTFKLEVDELQRQILSLKGEQNQKLDTIIKKLEESK